MKKHLLLIHLIVTFFGLILLYKNVTLIFGYWGFTFEINFFKILISIISLLSTVLIFLKKQQIDFSTVFLTYWIFFIFSPISVLFSCSLIDFRLYIIHILFLFTVGFFLSLKKELIFTKKIIRPRSFENNKFLILLTSFFIALPIISMFPNFTFSSFNLSEIYDVRLEARGTGNKLIGYTKELSSRIIFPFFMIYGYLKKKWILFFLSILLIVFVYGSSGALKSILAVIPVSLFFIKSKNYETVLKKILFICYCLIFLPLLETQFSGTYFLTDLPSRRLFFTAGLLENAYFLEYLNNYQFYTHSFLKFFNPNPESIPKLIGAKYFGRPEMNANVGVLIDGFLNLSYLGVILHAFIIYISIAIINGIKVKSSYFGVFFIYFYYLNTSFLSTLYLTHGLLFLIVFFYLIKSTHANTSNYPKL